MSDEELSPEEALLKRHRKEKKELQGKVQNLKKTSSKGDKKKKKEVTEEIARLEEELKTRHEKELQELHANTEVTVVAESLEGTTLSEGGGEAADQQDEKAEEQQDQQPRLSKAEKRRQKQEQKDKEREAEIKAAEEANRYGPRNLETQSIKEQLQRRGLAIHDVPSNGDCMFAAICHQIGTRLNLDVDQLRQKTADELRRSKDEYFPFLTNPNTGDMLSDDEYEEYCAKMASSKSAWGSQVELRAISQILKLRIDVIQGEGPVVVIGDDESTHVIVTFHKHYFGLGEHYNSTKPIPTSC